MLLTSRLHVRMRVVTVSIKGIMRALDVKFTIL